MSDAVFPRREVVYFYWMYMRARHLNARFVSRGDPPASFCRSRRIGESHGGRWGGMMPERNSHACRGTFGGISRFFLVKHTEYMYLTEAKSPCLYHASRLMCPEIG